MKTKKIISLFSACILLLSISLLSSCKKDKDETPSGINGYTSSGDVAKANLVAYWPLNGDGIESISSATPTNTKNVTWVDGVKGKAANFSVGFLNYNAIANLGTNLQSGFTVCCWAKLYNNGATASFIFQLARPGEWAGNINFTSETGWMKSTSDSITVKGLIVSTTDLGWQDSRNATSLSATDIASGGVAYPNKIGGQWAHIAYTWDNTTRTAKIYANGVKISNPSWEVRGQTGQTFGMTATTHPIIGATQTFADGTTTDSWNSGMIGQVDELRVYNKALTTTEIASIYGLEKLGK